jgi:hypothetical protein
MPCALQRRHHLVVEQRVLLVDQLVGGSAATPRQVGLRVTPAGWRAASM